MPRPRKTEPAKTKDKAQPPSIRGEKRVRATSKSLPVGPSRRARGTHDGPTDPAALDRRKQFSGTDEPADPKDADKPGRRARKPAGGNAGRPAVGLPPRT